MIKPIITGRTAINKRCEEVLPTDNYRDIIQDLKDTCHSLEAIGVAANQIGYNKRIFYICASVPEMFEEVMINPIITDKNFRRRIPGERCLSLPGLKIDTARYMQIQVEYFNEEFEKETAIFNGYSAVYVQHEIAHLNGRTILEDKWTSR